jgi:hypothetical protein
MKELRFVIAKNKQPGFDLSFPLSFLAVFLFAGLCLFTRAGDSPPPTSPHAEEIRVQSLAGRRLVCEKIPKVLPEGLVVESGCTLADDFFSSARGNADIFSKKSELKQIKEGFLSPRFFLKSGILGIILCPC